MKALLNGHLQRHWLYYLTLSLYVALVIPQLSQGLESLDAHAILDSVHKFVSEGRISVSRPPGHPTTEVYFYPAVAMALKGLGIDFSEAWYLALQAVAGILCLELFYQILMRFFSPIRSGLTVACLAFSPIFLANSFDGDEFSWATALLLFGTRLLLPRTGLASLPAIFGSMLALALATGCRPEAIMAGWIYPLYFCRSPRFGWKANFWALPVFAVLVLLVWLPLLWWHEVAPLTSSGMSLKQSLLGATYKLSFFVFTPLSVLLVAWALGRSATGIHRLLREPFPADAILAASVLISFSFLLFFYQRSDKPAYLLCGLPFALLLMGTQSFWVPAAVAGLTLLNCLVGVDVFRERQLCPPYFTRGYYLKAAMRAGDRRKYFAGLAKLHSEQPMLCIANAWKWDLDRMVREGTPPMSRVASPVSTGQHAAYRIGAAKFPLYFPHDALLDTDFLHRMNDYGYRIEVDRLLFRSTYEKYDVLAHHDVDQRIDGIPVKLF